MSSATAPGSGSGAMRFFKDEAELRALLRDAGFNDRAIHEIAQITGLFAYYNRLADGLGIDNEPEWT